jgi:predicted negative regulator of RcsB-dependent stress response
MAIAKKLMEKDNQKNLITGLVITTIALCGILYYQFRLTKDQKIQIAGLNQSISQIQEQYRQQHQIIGSLESENNQQRQVIANLENTNQVIAKQLSENQKQEPQA